MTHLPEEFKKIYKSLQEKKALERQMVGRRKREKEIEPFRKKDYELTLQYKEEIRKLRERYRKLERKEELKLPELEIEKSLKEKMKKIEEEIEKIAGPEEIKKIKALSWRNLGLFMRERALALKILKAKKENLEKFRKQIFTKPILLKILKAKKENLEKLKKQILVEPEITKWHIDILDKMEKEISEIERDLEEVFPNESPEAFMAHWLLKLREYQKQLPSGIVETPWVKEQIKRIKDVLIKNKLVALVGETGTGKTRIAQKIAQEMSKDGSYEFIGGHAFMTKEDLFSYLGMDVEEIPAETIPQRIKELKEKYKAKNPEATEEDLKHIEDIIKGQAMKPRMVAKVFETGVLKGAKEGRPVIVDEFNYIPPSLLAGCNALIEAKPGQEITVFGQKIKVKPGFGVIFTGNITKTEFKGRYLERKPIDPALVNRLNSGLIEYGSLPQSETLSFEESILERKFAGVKRESKGGLIANFASQAIR